MQSVVTHAYHRPIYLALGQQIPLALFSSLLLDGGYTSRIAGIAVAGFWAAVICIFLRRPQAPSSGDLNFIRIGLWPILFAVTTVAMLLRA